MLREEVSEAVVQAVTNLGIADVDVAIDYPAETKNGDYTTNVALIAAKKARKNPMELAEEIGKELRITNKELRIFEKIEVARPGFINFWITEAKFIEEIDSLRDNKALFDMVKSGAGKKVIVEYSSPNIAKPFTVGHLRSTIIGDAVSNLLEAVGATVYRDNHIGDWGTQFGKQIYAIKTWGNEETIGKSERPVKELVALYVKFHEEAEKDPSLEDKAREWFKKLEDGDAEAKVLWQKCIEWSWKEFNAIYRQLDVSFTENRGRGYGEAFFEDKMAEPLEELKEKNLLQEGKEGAKIVEFPDETKIPPLMIIKKDGATLYSTRDLATDRFRLFEHKEYGREVQIINEVGIEQTLYFQQLYKLEEMLGWVKPGQRVHIKHGHYRFKEGKMSTRKGNVIWLEDVLAEAENRAYSLAAGESRGKLGLERPLALHPQVALDEGLYSTPKNVRDISEVEKDIKDVAKQVAIGALKWNDLKRDPKQDITFDWDEILNMQGNSGPYLQYTYARTQSVLRKAGETDTKAFDIATANIAIAPEERDVLRLLAQFPEIVSEAATRLAPHLLCTYLFEAAQAFNLFYQKCQILKEEGETRTFRLKLTHATGGVLLRGLALLGIDAPERM